MDHITLTHCTKTCCTWLHIQSYHWNKSHSKRYVNYHPLLFVEVVYESYLPSHLNCNYTSRFFGEG